jgi:hypothetical protein
MQVHTAHGCDLAQKGYNSAKKASRRFVIIFIAKLLRRDKTLKNPPGDRAGMFGQKPGRMQKLNTTSNHYEALKEYAALLPPPRLRGDISVVDHVLRPGGHIPEHGAW